MSEKVSEVVARASRELSPGEVKAELASATASKLRPFAAVSAGLAALLAFMLLTAREGQVPQHLAGLVYVFLVTGLLCVVPALAGPARLARFASPHVSAALLVIVVYVMIGWTTIAQTVGTDADSVANFLLVMAAAVLVTTSWWTYLVSAVCAVAGAVATVAVSAPFDGWYLLEVVLGLGLTAMLVRWRRRAVVAAARERREAELSRQAVIEALAAQRNALQINNVIVQGLTAGLYALDDGDVDAARRQIGATLEEARALVAAGLGQETLLEVLAQLSAAPVPTREQELVGSSN